MRKGMVVTILLVMAVIVVPAYADPTGKPALPQGIRAVADNGDFLGILVNIALNENTGITTYIPSLGKFLELRQSNDITTARTRFNIYFDGVNCTGTAYLWPADNVFVTSHPEFLFVNQHTFYERVGDYTLTEYKSRLWWDGICEDMGTTQGLLAPIQEVQVDFTYPIVTPIGFE